MTRRAPRPHHRPRSDAFVELLVTVDRHDVDDPGAYRRIVELLADLVASDPARRDTGR